MATKIHTLTYDNYMKSLIIIIILLLGINCGVHLERKSFTSMPNKRSFDNIKIRLDGVYLGEVENKTKKGFLAYFFYQNGIALKYYLPEESGFNSHTNMFNGEKLLDTVKQIDALYKKKQAGGFRIENDKIQVQVFEFVNYGNYEVCTYKGQIINDSTIFISTCDLKSNSNFCPSEFYLKFYKMPKPDSMNQLMNKRWYWEN